MSQALRVLITGRHGFTGRYVAAELQSAGWDVWGVGTAASRTPGDQYFQADLTDRAALTQVIETVKPDAVVHLAAIAFVAHGTVEDFYRVNVIGTHILLDVVAQAGFGQSGVVLASSANIYGNAKASPIPETAIPAPVNDYAVSKMAMEHMARLFGDRLPITIARPFNYTGQDQSAQFLVPKIVAHFRDRAPKIELGNLDVARDFSDVRDVARIYRALLHSAPEQSVVNICSGVATSLEDILQSCQTITGHDMTIVVNPEFVRANEVKTLMGDATLCNQLVPASQRHSLQDTLDWMLEQ